jgi:hypothetical protein
MTTDTRIAAMPSLFKKNSTARAKNKVIQLGGNMKRNDLFTVLADDVENRS